MPIIGRDKLYALVWKDPVKTVAGSLGCSDVWLKRVCSSAGIPVPDRGYWAKLRAGKAVIVRKLPSREPGVQDRVVIGKEPYRSTWPPNPERDLAEPPPIEPHFPEPIESVKARIEKAVGKVKAERDLTSPHLLIRRVLEEDEKRCTKPPNIPYRLRYTDPKFDSPFERRRLRILNSIFIALSKAGHKPWLSDEDARSIGVVVGSQQVSFKLDHPKAKADRDGHFRPRSGGVDTLRLTVRGEEPGWTDTSDRKLEACLTDIVVELILAGEQSYRSGEVWAYERECKHRLEMEALLRKRREEAERLERELRIKAERSRRRSLLRMSRDLRQADEMRTMVKEVVQRADRLSANELEGLQRWARWALAVADRSDPMNRIRFREDGTLYLQEIELPAPDS